MNSNPRLERIKRERARRHPQSFATYVDPDYAIPYSYNHTRFLFEQYKQAFDGTLWEDGAGIRILCVSMPPGHLKTSCTNKFAAWCLGRWVGANESHEIALVSYGASLAESNSRTVLELIQTQRYQNVFPDVRLSEKSRAVSEWSIAGTYGSSCVAVGVGGALTGRRARGMFIDDPVKDAIEANSVSKRESIWEWWLTVASTRLLRDSIVVIPHTRWHEDDLTGRIIRYSMKNPGSYRVKIVRLPAIAESQAERIAASNMGYPLEFQDAMGRNAGEALCDEIATADELNARRVVSPSQFDALYQGRPRKLGGNLIGRDKFKIVESLPSNNITFAYGVDWAFTEKEVSPQRRNDPDYTAIALMALHNPDGDKGRAIVYLIGVWRVQASLHDAKAFIKKVVLANGQYAVCSFKDNIDRVAIEGLQRDPDLHNYSVKLLPRPKGDKVVKAQPWIDRAEGGMVHVLSGAGNGAFFDELEAFPKGVHDDMIDAVSVGYRAIGLAKGRGNFSFGNLEGFYG